MRIGRTRGRGTPAAMPFTRLKLVLAALAAVAGGGSPPRGTLAWLMEQNPFAPPTSAPPPAEGGLVFSSEGVEVVSSLAKWMRGLSVFYFIFIGLAGHLSCGTVARVGVDSARGGGIVIGLVVAMAVMIAATMFLREAASGFERGVYSDDEMTLGAGFRSLRIYLIIFGVIGILSALRTIWAIVG